MNYTAGRNKLVVLTALGVFFSLVFIFLGAPFLRLIRNIYGAKIYWAIGGVLFFGLTIATLFPLSFLIGSCWLVVGIYSEFEERGWSNFWTAAIAVVFSTTFLVAGTFYSMKAIGLDIREDLQKSIEGVLTQLKDPNGSTSEPISFLSGMVVDTKLVISQIPSIAVIVMIVCLAYGLMMERRIAMFFRLPHERVASQLKLLEFRIPDGFVWIAMLSFLGSFMRLQNENVALLSMNIFNVMLGLYFFQGLAVMEVVLQAFRAGPVLRFFVYFVVVFQLFFILSAVGFIDYWVDVRRRLKNLREKRRKQNNGEHV